MNKKIIGITGKAGVGKSAISSMIENAIPGTRIVSFSDPLKEFTQAVFDFPRDWLYGSSELRSEVYRVNSRYWSETLARFWSLGGAFHKEWLTACGLAHGTGGNAFVDWFHAIRRECENDLTKLSARHVLQQLGSEFGRVHIHPDVWANVAFHRIANSDAPVCVIPDVRFDNEAQMVRNAGGQVWRVLRNYSALTDSAAAHVSERGVSAQWVNTQIPNFGTFDQLRKSVHDELYFMGLT